MPRSPVTAADLRALDNRGNPNKYGARRTWSELCQHQFDSKAEALHAEDLWLLQRAGEISGLEFHPVYVLAEKPNGKRKVWYEADFRYREKDGKEVVVDVKGRETPASRIKRAWLLDKLGVEVQIVWV